MTENSRLRATWRVVIPLCIWFVVALVAQLGLRRIVVALDISLPPVFGQFSVFLIYLPVVLVLLFVAPQLDRRTYADYGLDTSSPVVRNISAGLGIGVLSSGIPNLLGIVLGYGAISATFVRGTEQAVIGLIFAVVLAQLANVFLEEFLYRGILIQNAAEGISNWISSRTASIVGGVIVISVIFGFSHVIFGGGGGTEGRSLSLVLTSTLAGLGWGTAYILTGNLWFPMGIHLGYNLSNAMVFQPNYESVAFQFPTVFQIGIIHPAFWEIPRSLVSLAVTMALVVAYIRIVRSEWGIDDRVAPRVQELTGQRNGNSDPTSESAE